MNTTSAHVPQFTEQEKRQKRTALWENALKQDSVDALKQLFHTAEDVRNATWWMWNPDNDTRPENERDDVHTGTKHLIDALCTIHAKKDDEGNVVKDTEGNVVESSKPRVQCLTWTLSTFQDAYTEQDIKWCVNKKLKPSIRFYRLDAMMKSKYQQLLNCVEAHLNAMQNQEADTAEEM